MNKIILLLTCFFISSATFGRISSGYAITKDDSDTTVNLRDGENLQSKILAKTPNGTPISCSFDFSSNPTIFVLLNLMTISLLIQVISRGNC